MNNRLIIGAAIFTALTSLSPFARAEGFFDKMNASVAKEACQYLINNKDYTARIQTNAALASLEQRAAELESAVESYRKVTPKSGADLGDALICTKPTLLPHLKPVGGSVSTCSVVDFKTNAVFSSLYYQQKGNTKPTEIISFGSRRPADAAKASELRAQAQEFFRQARFGELPENCRALVVHEYVEHKATEQTLKEISAVNQENTDSSAYGKLKQLPH